MEHLLDQLILNEIKLLPLDGTSIRFVNPITRKADIQINGFGFRINISNAANGDDIWTGTATTLPIPPDAGEQMQIVSTSASDTLTGIGSQIVKIHYIDASGNDSEEHLNMNGATPVLTVATNIRFVQHMHVMQSGTNLLSVGTITISKAGAASTIYTQILLGTNESLNTARMIPVGKVCLMDSFNASGGAAAGGKSADIRLRITEVDGKTYPRLFHFKDNFLAFNSGTSRKYNENPIIVPPLSIVKCTAYASVGGADVQASWSGKLIDIPV